MVPVYEAKMLHHYDHRWATYEGGSIRDVTDAEKNDPSFAVLPRYWVEGSEMTGRLPGSHRNWLLAFRDIARSTDERTLTCSPIPLTAVGHTAPLAFATHPELLSAMWSSLAYDYVTRQKVGGTHITYSYLKQLPTLGRPLFESESRWDAYASIATWLSARSAELGYTARDIEALGCGQELFEWNTDRRTRLRSELDSAFFHLYGITRDDVSYILDTFPILRGKDEARFGEYRTKRVVLEVFDALQHAIDTGEPYRTVLDPAPGRGPRHEIQEVAV
ncbi:hypothetical protein [Williamsia sp. D3]|uniref:hypothetical protein n=1 Tax=Williamsia sp. D3 TaxID=1313067 RepID=UPI001F3A048E|nr:hypothetical protein [Williamsia sp. D3]